jgi:hypothetical protein
MKKNLTYLIAIAAIILLSFGAKAQGGLAPLAGSSHNYTVTPESTSNILLWSVVETSGYTINSQSVVTTTSVADITWTAAGTYTLQFTETNATTLCATTKQITVTVSNAFDVSVSSLTAICNTADGVVNYSGTNATTSISFPVSMVTGVSIFNPDWEIEFTLTPGTGTTILDVDATFGSLSGTGPYTLTALTSASGAGSVNITMDVTGNIYTLLDVVLEITSAKELTNNNSDKDIDDWTSTQTINAIPNTSTITTD